jgi:hypothetical protein
MPKIYIATQSDIANMALTTDPRFTDARPPLSHTHPMSEITALTTTLATKADLVAGKVPASQLPASSAGGPSVTSVTNLGTARGRFGYRRRRDFQRQG